MKLSKLAVAAAASAVLCGCRAENREGNELTLWVLPDLHYLSPDLYKEDAVSFQKLLASNDGKMIEQMPECMDAFKQQALDQHPDYILVPGDLTMNGEYESLLELKELFSQLNNSGIGVLVIPGNHDINYPLSFDLSGDTPSGTRNIPQDDFTEVMKEFGYEDSHSHAPDSFSYTYEIADDLWVMALDANTEKAPGSLTDETLLWAEDELRYARDNRIRVITMTHQNVLKQSSLLYQGYVINNADAIEHLLKN